MAVLISLGGKSGGDGFLVAPLDSTYDAELSLATDAGTASVTLSASPNPAGLVFSTVGPIALTTTPTIVRVHSTLQSNTRGDTTIVVNDGAGTFNYTLTSIKDPVINFNGKFETRFATDALFPNANPIYQPPPTADSIAGGWTWGLEGEPDFVPGGTVPTTVTTTGVGRVVRLNNPVALRPLLHNPDGTPNPTGTVPPVVSTVKSITGKVAMAPVNQTFTAGDPLIGQPVNFGPDTYIAGNNDGGSFPGLPGVEEVWSSTREVLALFQFRLGTAFAPPALYFRGASKVSGFVMNSTAMNQQTRVTDSRPKPPGGIVSANAEFTELGLDDVPVFNDKRIDALVHDYQALPAGASAARRNLVRRLAHLLGALTAGNPRITSVPALGAMAVPPDDFTARASSLNLGKSKEVFTGKVDDDLHAWPGGPPGGSSVVDYLRQFPSFDFIWNVFAFHSDENCGYHTGTFKGNLSMTGNHIGDPHTRTVNGTNYDFQAVGEFTLLHDGAAMEIQVRQSPVATANPHTDDYSGLKTCVSLITAVAARIGKHRVSYQPGREARRLEFYIDGKHATLTADGIDVGGSRVSAFDANGETGMRVDYDDGTVMTVTPRFWTPHQAWYMDVSVSNTQAVEGLMGYIPKENWLPRLRNGQTLGPRPAGLPDRYKQLYKTFADSWRITDATSLFVYASGTSTKTFTDPAWPAEKPPCTLLPQFQIPGVGVHQSIPVAEAEAICRGIHDKDLFKHCVFDVATTGDKFFAEGYHQVQELRLYGTKVEISGHPAAEFRRDRSAPNVEPARGLNQSLIVTATVSPLESGRPTPTGTVTLIVDGVPMRRAAELDDSGSVRVTVGPLKLGDHKIRATYSGGGKYNYHSSSSPNLVHAVEREREVKPPR